MTVYIDIIFLENLFMNYIIIFATAISIKEKTRAFRFFIASLIGSLYAVIIYINILKIINSSLILKILLSFVMVYIAFNPKNLKMFIKELVIFYLISFTFGGVAFALIYFTNPKNILMEKGVLIGTYPIKIILFGGIIGFMIITFAFKNIKAKLNAKSMLCKIKISINNKSTYIKAIIDTGNFLEDPISKIPVMVVEKNALQEIIPIEILNNLNNIINGKILDIGDYASKIKFIPFNSLGKQNGMLLGFKADNILINQDENNIFIKNIIVGIYDGTLSKNNKYSRFNRFK